MKNKCYFLIFLTAVIMLSGCGGVYTSPTEDTQLIGIALCANEDWPEYPVAQKLQQRLLETGSIRVDLENAGEVAELQDKQIGIMIANGADAIAITYVEGADQSDMLTMVRAANVPLIEINRDACRDNPDEEMMRLYNAIMSSRQ